MSDQAEASSEAPVAESTENNEQSQEQSAQAGAEGQEPRSDAQIEADKSLTKTEKVQEKRLKQLNLKFNGQDYNEDLPFDIPDTKEAKEYMQKHLQMSKLSQSKSQEFAALQKEAIDFIEALRKDPASVLSNPNLGIDVKQFAARIIEQEIENSKKSPQQLEKEKLEKELQSLKGEREREKKENRDREFQKLTNEYYDKYESQLNEALEKSTLPKNPHVINRVADHLLAATKAGLDVNVSDILPIVEQEFREELKQMFSIMPEEVMESLVGKENINKLRKKNLAKAKAAPQAQALKASVKDVGQKTEKVSKEPAPKLNYKEFFKI